MRRILLIFTAVMLMFSVTACGDEKEQLDEYTPGGTEMDGESYDDQAGFRKTVLYYVTDDGFFVPVTKSIPWEEGIGKAALSYLLDEGSNAAAAAMQGLCCPVPEGTSFSLRISDDAVATVDIMNADCADAEAEQRMVTAVVNTLCEFPTIERVTVRMNGEDESAYGTDLSEAYMPIPMNVSEGSVSASADGVGMATVYFMSMTGALAVPVTRYYEHAPTFTDAVNTLVEGEPGLLSCFAAGTEMVSAKIEDGVAKVELTGGFTDGYEAAEIAAAAVTSIYYTANASDTVYDVSLIIDGAAYDMTSAASASYYINSAG